MSRSLDDGSLLPEIFARSVRLHGDRVAIDVPPGTHRQDRTCVTYRELDIASSALAATVQEHVGIEREPIVAILLPRERPALYAAQLGATKAGAAFTCLDPAFPDDHVRSVIADAHARLVLTDAAGAERLRRCGIDGPRVIDVEAPKSAGTPLAPRGIQPDQLAYVIYTSGTTGAAKGVLIEQRSIANLVRSDIGRFGLTCHDRVAQCSSAAYDSSLEETWLAFAVGATLVLLDDETVRLGPDLVPWLSRERISVFCPPPTLLRTTGCVDPKRALPDLKFIYVGGEALTQDLADVWGDGIWLENGYGPTECTVTVMRTRVWPGKPVTIGSPVEGHRAWVLDEDLAEVSDGEQGELCIAGVGLARGYRNRPEVTAEKFIEHAAFGRIYRTGDLVRRNAAGEVEYLGRIDGQIKLRGYRVELAAIDAVLAQCAGVREAACCVQGENGEQLLVAHVVANGAGRVDAERLATAVRQLPA